MEGPTIARRDSCRCKSVECRRQCNMRRRDDDVGTGPRSSRVSRASGRRDPGPVWVSSPAPEHLDAFLAGSIVVPDVDIDIKNARLSGPAHGSWLANSGSSNASFKLCESAAVDQSPRAIERAFAPKSRRRWVHQSSRQYGVPSRDYHRLSQEGSSTPSLNSSSMPPSRYATMANPAIVAYRLNDDCKRRKLLLATAGDSRAMAHHIAGLMDPPTAARFGREGWLDGARALVRLPRFRRV